MVHTQTLYPYALAGVNVGVGWFLYRTLGSPFGLVLVMVGIGVLLAVVGGAAYRFTPVARDDAETAAP